jgi:hypothetical protein
MTQEQSTEYDPERFAAQKAEARADQKRYAETPQQRWGFPADYASILALLDCIPTRDELRAPEVPPPIPPKEPRRRGSERLHGEAARLRKNRLTRIYYARLTDEQRAERNRKRRAHYARQRAAIQAREERYEKAREAETPRAENV